jgi:hypothetical protein
MYKRNMKLTASHQKHFKALLTLFWPTHIHIYERNMKLTASHQKHFKTIPTLFTAKVRFASKNRRKANQNFKNHSITPTHAHMYERNMKLTASHQKHFKALLILFLAKVRFASKKAEQNLKHHSIKFK